MNYQGQSFYIFSELGVRKEVFRTMKQILLLLLGIILLLPIVSAEQKAVDVEAEIMKIQSQLIGLELTGPIGTLFGDEKINVNLKSASGDELVVGIITEEKKVKAVNLNAVVDPSLEVYTEMKTMAVILVSEKPLLQLQKALSEKKVTYKAVGLWHKLKFAFLDTFVNLLKDVDVTTIPEEDVTVVEGSAAPEKAKDTPAADVSSNSGSADDEKKDTDSSLTGAVVAPSLPEQVVHVVEMSSLGFSPEILTINAGDKVVWKNVRSSGSVRNAMIIGTQKCQRVRSPGFGNGESFEWTFSEPVKCTFVDGFMTTKSSRIVVNK